MVRLAPLVVRVHSSCRQLNGLHTTAARRAMYTGVSWCVPMPTPLSPSVVHTGLAFSDPLRSRACLTPELCDLCDTGLALGLRIEYVTGLSRAVPSVFELFATHVAVRRGYCACVASHE